MTMKLLSLAVVVVGALLLSGTVVTAAAEAVVDLSQWVRPLPPSVSDWTPLDVETWMSQTIGYPEYVPTIRTHLIDGPTLLNLDVALTFEPRFHVHGVKIKTHISILRGNCACTSDRKSTDLWSYFEAHREVVTRLGSALAYSPRFAFAYLFAWDLPRGRTLMGVEPEAELPWPTTVLYIVVSLVAPYVLIAYKLLAFWSLNIFTVSLLLGYFAVSQISEVMEARTVVRLLREGVRPTLRSVFGHLVIPLGVNVAAFVLPDPLMWILGLAFLGHCVFKSFVLIFGIGHSIFTRVRGSSEDTTDERKSEKTE